jgi:hypothetical protein
MHTCGRPTILDYCRMKPKQVYNRREERFSSKWTWKRKQETTTTYGHIAIRKPQQWKASNNNNKEYIYKEERKARKEHSTSDCSIKGWIVGCRQAQKVLVVASVRLTSKTTSLHAEREKNEIVASDVAREWIADWRESSPRTIRSILQQHFHQF